MSCSPMDLPPEILSLVFVHSLDAQLDRGDDGDVLGQLSSPRHPHLLGSVCREWRAVVWSTPQLWNRLAFAYDIDHLHADFTRIGVCLQRSGGLPIRLALFVKGHSFTSVSDEGASYVAKTFAKHCARWEHVLLHLPLSVVRAMSSGCYSLGSSTLGKQQQKMPFLRTLRLQLSMRDVPYSRLARYTSVPLAAFSEWTCPRLEEISVRQSPFTLFRNAPWGQITRISGLAISLLQLIDLLRVAPRLVDIDIIENGLGDELGLHASSTSSNASAFAIANAAMMMEAAQLMPVTHDRLRTLAVKSGGDDHSPIASTHQLLDYLALPALEELRMSKFGGHWYPHTFDRFVARSGGLTQLRKLRVAGYHGMGDDEASAALALLPSLTECALMGALHAGNARIGDRFLAKLIAKKGSSGEGSSPRSPSKMSQPLFPNMQKLKLLPCRFTDGTQNILVRLLASRARQRQQEAEDKGTVHGPEGHPPLFSKRIIELYCDEGASRWDGDSPSAALLEALQGQGIELHVHSATTCWLDYPGCRQRRAGTAMDSRTWPGSPAARTSR